VNHSRIKKVLGLFLFLSVFAFGFADCAAGIAVEDGAGQYAMKIIKVKKAQAIEIRLAAVVLRSCNTSGIQVKSERLQGGSDGPGEVYWLEASVLQTMKVCDEDLFQKGQGMHETLYSSPLVIQSRPGRAAASDWEVIVIFPREFELKVREISGKL